MKTHFFWIVEVFVWVLILFLISGGIMLSKMNYRKNFSTYQMFLPDVDGLINGSPVKMMGIQVGYVNQIDIVGEDVYVKFIITDKSVKIPYGSRATVEFSGLGGSKSLEIYPSENKSSDRLINSQSPKRIHDSISLLYDMFDQIVEITYSVSNFMDKVGIIKADHKTSVQNEKGRIQHVRNANDFLDFSDRWIEKTQKQVDNIGEKLKNGNNKLNSKNKSLKKDEKYEQSGAENE